MANHLLWIPIFVFQMLVVNPAFAGIAEVYTSTSKSLYEFVQNKKCGDFFQEELKCESCRSSSKISTESLNDVVENAFFRTAAEEEVKNLGCEISKIKVIQKDSKVVKRIKEDLTSKLKPLRAVYDSLVKAKFDYLRAQDKANQMRSYSTSTKVNEMRYSSLRKEAANKKEEAEQLHAVFEAILQSIWMGNSQTVRSFLKEMIKDDSVKTGQIPKSFDKEFELLFAGVSKELQANRNEIAKQDYSSLDLKTKSKFSQNAYYADIFSERAKLSKQSSAKLQCRLDAKYVKGNEYLDNTIFAASLFLSGGGALLSKAPTVLVSTLGQATRAGQIAFNSSRVLLATGAGASAHLMLEEFDRTCGSSLRGLTRKNLCAEDPQKILSDELMNLEEGNCALSVAVSSLSIVPAAIGLKNVFINPLNLTRAPIKPKIIGIDDVDEIKKMDPYQRFNYREDLRQIRGRSGRLGDKYVKKLPELKGSLKEAFDGPIEQQKFKTGQVVWQIQRSNQENTGRWFSTSVAKNREEAEALFNVEKWGNDRGQMRMFIVKDDFTAYTGKVAGGTGDQLFVPSSVPVEEVLQPLSFRSVPGGKVYSDLAKIPKGKVIEISTEANDGSLLLQGEFVSFRKGKGEYDSITVRDPVSHGLATYPFKASDRLVVRDIYEGGLEKRTPYPESWSREIRDDGPVEVTRIYKDDSGTYIQSTFRGLFTRSSKGPHITLEGPDGKKISFPREELNGQYSHKLTPEEYKVATAPLKKGETYLSNLMPGDKVRLKAVERTTDGHKVTREFTGEYQGIDAGYVVIKRPDDVAPIYISQFDVPQQRVKQLRSADSYNIPLDEKKRKWLPKNPPVEVRYVDEMGRSQTVRGILEPSYNHDGLSEIVVRVNGKLVAVPNTRVLPGGFKLIRSQLSK